MGKNTLVSGGMESNMEEEYLNLQTGKREKENGKTESELNGYLRYLRKRKFRFDVTMNIFAFSMWFHVFVI